MKKLKLFRNYYNTVLMVIILLSFSLTACMFDGSGSGSRAAGKDQSDEASEVDYIKVKFTYRKSDIDFDKIISDYNSSANRSFQVEAVSLPADKYDETLNALFTSGKGPDVFEIGKEWVDGFITKGWLYNLRNSFDNEMLNDYPGWIYQFIPETDFTGEVYTLPTSLTTIRLLYNRDLFKLAGLDPESPPKTLEELKQYALKITNAAKGYKKYGFALNAGDGSDCFERFLENANTFSGVNYFDYKQSKYDLNVYAPWFQAIKAMKDNESIFPGETVLKNSKALSQFAEGNIGMMYADFNALISLEQLRVKSSKACDWGAALPPALDAASLGKGKSSIVPTGFYCVNAGSKNMEGSVRFWYELYSKESLQSMYKKGYIIPVLDGLADDREYMPDIKNFDKFLPGENDAVYPAAIRNVQDWSRFDAYLEAIHGSKPIEEILKSESNNLNFILEPVLANEQNNERYQNFDWLYPLKR